MLGEFSRLAGLFCRFHRILPSRAVSGTLALEAARIGKNRAFWKIQGKRLTNYAGLRRWDDQKPWWTALAPEEWDAGRANVYANDFPETTSRWHALGHEAGFGQARENGRSASGSLAAIARRRAHVATWAVLDSLTTLHHPGEPARLPGTGTWSAKELTFPH